MTRYRAITEKDSRQERLTNFFQLEIRRRDEQALRDILSSESGRWFLMHAPTGQLPRIGQLLHRKFHNVFQRGPP